jgi:peptidyl-prolyl cis-trans isomerase A (cyclophilin A)
MKIIIRTEYGDITLELYPDRAPITVNNFLQYIQDGVYIGSTFYRQVTPHNQPNNPIPISVIQGGIGMEDDPRKRVPIALETTQQTGLKHFDGSISMSRFAPGTSNSEFFICLDDQPELDFGGRRNPDGQGFSAFGRVIEGMEIVKKIHACPVNEEWFEPPITILAIELKP